MNLIFEIPYLRVVETVDITVICMYVCKYVIFSDFKFSFGMHKEFVRIGVVL